MVTITPKVVVAFSGRMTVGTAVVITFDEVAFSGKIILGTGVVITRDVVAFTGNLIVGAAELPNVFEVLLVTAATEDFNTG